MTRAYLGPGKARLRKLVSLAAWDPLGLIKTVLGHERHRSFSLLSDSDVFAATATLVSRAGVYEAFVTVFIGRYA